MFYPALRGRTFAKQRRERQPRFNHTRSKGLQLTKVAFALGYTFCVPGPRDSIQGAHNNKLRAQISGERQHRGAKTSGAPGKVDRTVEVTITDIIQRLAVNSIIFALWDYERRDLRGLTRGKRAKVVSANRLLFKIAVDTLAGRPVECEDRPTKLEAVDLLKQLVFGVPNNLTKADKQIAKDALTVLVALLPDEQPGGFVN